MHRGDTSFLVLVLSVVVIGLGHYATGDETVLKAVSLQDIVPTTRNHQQQQNNHNNQITQQQESHHSKISDSNININELKTKTSDKSQQTKNPVINKSRKEFDSSDVGDSISKSATNSIQSANQNSEGGNKVIAQVETSLLKMFGFNSRPRPKDNIVIPQYMIDLYKQEAGVSEVKLNLKGKRTLKRFPGNTIRSYYHEELTDESDDYPRDHHRTTLHFNLTHFPKEESLQGSELRIYRHRANDSTKFPVQNSKEPSSSINKPHRIDIYEVIKPPTNTEESISRLIDTRHVYPHKSKWESFDIEPALKKWRNKPHLNHGLEVHYTDLNGDKPHLEHVRLRRAIQDNVDNSWSLEQPVLVLYSDDGKDKHIREKRRAGDERDGKKKKKSKDRERAKQKKKRKNHCKRHPLFVDFQSVGWTDWIIAPAGYDAYFCHGECPFYMPDHLNATNHAIVQNMVNSFNPQAAPKPCCVPTELSAIAMLYLDDVGKVVLKTYQEMVVDACGCR